VAVCFLDMDLSVRKLQLCLLNCNKIRAGGVVMFMGGSVRWLFNLCFGWVNYRLERRKSFNINRHI